MSTGWSTYLATAAHELRRSEEHDERLFPHYSEEDSWELLDVEALSSWTDGTYEHGNWTAGFWFGTMWLAALGTGSEEYAAAARRRLSLLESRAQDHTTHDLGFMFHPSYVMGNLLGYLTEEEAKPALEAARMTVLRFNEPGRYIQAFGPVGDRVSATTSTVDTLMNLPLLWWAHSVTGEARFLEVGRQHARTSARLLVRPDDSTVHLMHLDPVTGAFTGESTLQGAGTSSTWSRGQGWAVAGFAWAYAVTGEVELLHAAERTARYYEERAGTEELPPWDFAETSGETLPDASAAAVVALGYQILSERHPDPARREEFGTRAGHLLETIRREALNTRADIHGYLLRSNYSVPHGRGRDGATAWGDFYIGLALAIADGAVPLSTVLSVDSR